MAKSLASFTWTNGFRQPTTDKTWDAEDRYLDQSNNRSHYTLPPSAELLTSTVHNSLGLNVLRTWPTLFDGTNSPHGIPDWWNPPGKVDVLICGAGPCGLEIAISLLRQGVSFRIIDKADTPLLSGRADAVQPRFLEALHMWGLAQEVHEEGPILESSSVYKDGKRLFYDRAYQSDSRYRGVHVITQGQLERVYIRDLMRHKMLIERSTTAEDVETNADPSGTHPVRVRIKNHKSGAEETIQAKFIVGSDGAASSMRKRLQIPFDGNATDIYWAIIDCIFESDFPYIKIFGLIINSEHGGCVIVPREDGYLRIYVQVDTKSLQNMTESRQAKDPTFMRSGGRVDVNSFTAEEVLEQANRIFAPYTLRFAAPVSWFAVWRINERCARSFSSEDLRIHLAGDAAHVHSAMGAFGLNAAMMDAANLGWKLGFCAQGHAKLSSLGPTYDRERRLHARRIINVSGSYLRFLCNSKFPPTNLKGLGVDLGDDYVEPPALDGTTIGDLMFLRAFYTSHSQFLLGVDAAYGPSAICPPSGKGTSPRPISVLNGVRAPNPRICFDRGVTGYLYDKLIGGTKFHLVVFGSDLQGPVRERLARFSAALGSSGFYSRFGGPARFNVILLVKTLPFETAGLLAGSELSHLARRATILYDDRAPDEDAHYWYGVNHACGAVVVVRPDLWVGVSAFPDAPQQLDDYFESFLVPVVDDGADHLPNGFHSLTSEDVTLPLRRGDGPNGHAK